MKVVLVIEDDHMTNNLICTFLERYEFQCAQAFNGTKGFELFKQLNPDIVITDIVMEDGDGIEFILKALEYSDRQANIIAISSGGKIKGAEYLKVAKTMGVKATFEKPVNLDELLGVVDRLVSGEEVGG